eukprot:jgi/Chrzof1/14330/UNPLg00603.t1
MEDEQLKQAGRGDGNDAVNERQPVFKQKSSKRAPAHNNKPGNTKKKLQRMAATTTTPQPPLPHELMTADELDMDLARKRQELAILVQQQLDDHPRTRNGYVEGLRLTTSTRFGLNA